MQLATIRKRRIEVSVPFGEEVLTVGVNPGLYNDEFVQSLGEITTSEALSRLITDWDLADGEEAVPHDGVTLAALPLDFKTEVLRAIGEALLPNRKTAEPSGSFW
jgi:hypothetical protein